MPLTPALMCPLVVACLPFPAMLRFLPAFSMRQVILVPVILLLVVSRNHQLHAGLQFFRMFSQRVILIAIGVNDLVREISDVFVAGVLVMTEQLVVGDFINGVALAHMMRAPDGLPVSVVQMK
jgi:hypothetical protein